jgi:hypothetical protein
MTTNVGSLDRIARVIAGIFLLALAVMGTGEWHYLGWLGIIPLATAAIGYCPTYSILGVSTCATKQ